FARRASDERRRELNPTVAARSLDKASDRRLRRSIAPFRDRHLTPPVKGRRAVRGVAGVPGVPGDRLESRNALADGGHAHLG
ncbi:MAG TPA: hypothetical protein VGW38_04805, partial [Chloroflexota bacterium]|nr:hypothetical protein [Chloroflexota bacterium]